MGGIRRRHKPSRIVNLISKVTILEIEPGTSATKLEVGSGNQGKEASKASKANGANKQQKQCRLSSAAMFVVAQDLWQGLAANTCVWDLLLGSVVWI